MLSGQNEKIIVILLYNVWWFILIIFPLSLLNADNIGNSNIWPWGYKTFFMLNSAEHDIYEHDKCNIWET